MKATEPTDQKKAIITNFYEFQFPNNLNVLHSYKVTVHPKMEKSAFLKSR
jgi:hypothetical protein